MWHGYFGIENLNLNASQKATLIEELQRLGPSSHRSPACLNHWRVRLDGEAVIFEALFNAEDDDLLIVTFKQRLATIFEISVEDITHSTSQQSFSGYTTTVVTYGYGGTDYLRIALFGNIGANWMESGDECRGYLKANIAEWE